KSPSATGWARHLSESEQLRAPLPSGSRLEGIHGSQPGARKPMCGTCSPAVPATHCTRRICMRIGRTRSRAVGRLIAALGSLVAIMVPTATTATSVQAAVPAPYVQQGYWIVTTDGSVFNYGAALNFGGGAAPGKAVWLATTPSGMGYWIPTFGGVVHTFGDAPFLGDASKLHLNA